MASERNIGHIVTVDSLSVFVKLDDDLKSLYKSGYEEIYPVARINSYIIIPVGADKIVALVDRVMNREETDLTKNSGTIFLTESSRYLSATMIGTIENGKYIQGVYNYPILDNPVWYVTRKDLDIIFDQKEGDNPINFKEDYYLPIGKSPSFPDYQVKINPDKMFGKHAAILGNTGSGKSCTLTSIFQSMFQYDYNGQKLHSAHVVIFDTNGEYKEAFNIEEKHKVNPFYINEDGLKVPYWFMNFDDMDYLFEPTTGTQAPILKRALALAKSHTEANIKKHISRIHINLLLNFLAAIERQDWTTNNAIYNDSETVYNCFKTLLDERVVNFDLTEICNALKSILDEKAKLSLNQKGYVQGNTDVAVLDAAISKIQAQIDIYREQQVDNVTSENRNIDFPLYFNFKEMMSACFDAAIQETSVSQDKINEYVSTLKLRMQSFVDDIRLAEPLMLDKQLNVIDSLIQFLAFVLGDYCMVYNKEEYKDSVFQTYYSESFKQQENKQRNQMTIIDMSLLPFQVLETITGLIGRMILEFLSRFDKEKRGSVPVVIALEEAQNYIPEVNHKDRESISKKVFERIAREGRKYGLSLVVSSQRPSELSKTVLSQCNSFIVHRIQNPDDQNYIRKLVSSANSEILNQLPTLPQQHVIIMGDCVRTPIVARMNDANPRPNSNNPSFIDNWLKDGTADYERVAKKWTEQREGIEEAGKAVLEAQTLDIEQPLALPSENKIGESI
jgi:hypothetical protein